jgi:IMP dehydrogenase
MEISGKVYKQYRGMGSLSAMKAGSAARYGHDKADQTRKVAAEGIEALKEVSGSVDDVLGHPHRRRAERHGLPRRRDAARSARQGPLHPRQPAGQKEAAPHDVIEVSTRTSSS